MEVVMTNYSTGTFASLTFQDYKEVLDPTNQIVELDQNKLLTNCICPHHKDNNPYTTTLNGLHEQGVINSFTLDKLLSVRKNRTGSLRAEGREPRGIVQQYKQQQGVANGI